jgi:quercetin dioxygenase-like cupin family protein
MSRGKRPVLLRPGEGESAAQYTLKLTSDDTTGAYAVREVKAVPGRRIPRHVHSRESEAWYVLEGELTFSLDSQEFVAVAGGFVYLPVGVAHSFCNSGDGLARFLQIFAPAGLEQYFVERTALADGTHVGVNYAGLDADTHTALAQKFGLRFLED